MITFLKPALDLLQSKYQVVIESQDSFDSFAVDVGARMAAISKLVSVVYLLLVFVVRGEEGLDVDVGSEFLGQTLP